MTLPADRLNTGLASRDLSEISLEDLMNVEVTSVSKREQKLSQTAAAIHVITQEDIRRVDARNMKPWNPSQQFRNTRKTWSPMELRVQPCVSSSQPPAGSHLPIGRCLPTRRFRQTPSSQNELGPAGSLDRVTSEAEDDSPRHQFQVHSYLKLWNRLELDNSFYRLGAVEDKTIPGYNRLDARLGWRFTESLDLSVAAQNLLDPHHAEGGRLFWERTTEMKRSAYLKFTWHF